jgi:hypothetical protein
MILLDGHRGKHWPPYHDEVDFRMDQEWDNLSVRTKANARAALNRVNEGIIRDIVSGKLKLYEDREVSPAVIKIPRQVARMRVRGNGNTFGIVIEAIGLLPGAIFEAQFIKERMNQDRSFSEATVDLWNCYSEIEKEHFGGMN